MPTATILKYGLVGISGMAVDFSVTWLCKERIGLNKYIANSLGFSLAVVNNFLLNRYWTFAQSQTAALPQFGKFTIISIGGLLINNLLLYLFINYSKTNFYIAKLLVIGIVFFWNFFMNQLFTFAIN
jgi:putative flippase GtrA